MTYTDPKAAPPPPTHETHVTDNRGSNTGAWVVAALVAVVAIIAVAFMVTNQPAQPDDVALNQAMEQGRAQGMLEGAQATIDSARSSAESAANVTAAQAEAAADRAAASADSAARSASDAADDASATVTIPTEEPAPQP